MSRLLHGNAVTRPVYSMNRDVATPRDGFLPSESVPSTNIAYPCPSATPSAKKCSDPHVNALRSCRCSKISLPVQGKFQVQERHILRGFGRYEYL